MMIGLALEGGGSRGAYQMGVVKGLRERGYEFDGFVGTSIGALNAAALAQGDLDGALAMWQRLSMRRLFDKEQKHLLMLGKEKWDFDLIMKIGQGLIEVVTEGGFDTSKMRNVVEECIDEDGVRGSGKEFGLVTVSLYDLEPHELYLDDIPEGKLVDYLMASACFPGFQSVEVDGVKYVDGGVYNNCPINMLFDKGYDEVVAIRLGGTGVYRDVVVPPGAKLHIIDSKENLGELMIFDHDVIEENIQRGYRDGLQFG